MLYRFREAKNAELGGTKKLERRPYRISEVSSLAEAEKWRRNVIGDISKKVSKIQDSKDPSLSLSHTHTRTLLAVFTFQEEEVASNMNIDISFSLCASI